MSLDQSAKWQIIPIPESNTFNQYFSGSEYRRTGKNTIEIKFAIQESSSNSMGFIHGAYLSAAAEMVLALPLWVKGSIDYGRAVTVDLDLKYMTNSQAARGLEAEVELLHETGKLGFLRGLLKQGEMELLSFQATVRKVPGKE